MTKDQLPEVFLLGTHHGTRLQSNQDKERLPAPPAQVCHHWEHKQFINKHENILFQFVTKILGNSHGRIGGSKTNSGIFSHSAEDKRYLRQNLIDRQYLMKLLAFSYTFPNTGKYGSAFIFVQNYNIMYDFGQKKCFSNSRTSK